MNSTPRGTNYGNLFDDYASPMGYLKTDVFEKDNNYYVEMEIPGITKDDIAIDSQNGYLMIGIARREVADETTRSYIRRERSYSQYSRQFYLGNIDPETIKAEYRDGILRVVVPRPETPVSKRVPIE